MNENIFVLKTCRLCLETNCRLYDINKNKLTNILDDFTSSTALDMPGLPQYICGFCYALLCKATTFRNRCIEVQNYLHECSLIEPLTIDMIKNIDRSRIQNRLYRAEILAFQCIDSDTVDDEQIEIKSENESEKESENESEKKSENNDNDDFQYEYIEMDFSIENQSDFVTLEDNVKPESSNQDVTNKSVVQTKHINTEKDTLKKKTKDKINKDEFKEVLQQQILNATDDRRQIKKYYVLEKKNVNMDLFDLDDEVLEKKNCPNAEDLEKIDPNEKIFYEYVNEKYKKGTLGKKKVVNVIHHIRNPVLKLNNPALLILKRITKVEKYKARRKRDVRVFDEMDEMMFDAIVLSKEEQIADLMARKHNPKFVNARYKCELCFTGFTAEKSYRTHLIVHDPNTGDKVCEICQSRFTTSKNLIRHTLRHKWKFVCKTCGAASKCSTEARLHYASHEGKKYICEHCGKIFSRYRTRIDHIRIYHGTSRCDICYKGLANQTAINLHKTKIHKQVFICDVCNVTFNIKSALNTHLSSLKTTCVNFRPCSACGENLKTDAELEDHITSVHPYIRPPLKLRCCPCGHAGPGATHNYDDHNIDHKITHDYKMAADSYPEFKMAVNTTEPKMSEASNETNESCNCPCKLVGRKIRPRRRKGLERKEDIKINASKEDHDTPKKKFMCEVCAMGFMSEAALKCHQRIHTGERPYQCPMCPKRFRLKDNLHNHVNTHTGERPYKCPHCPKAFRTNTANHRHQLVHNKKRPHRCDICDKTFQTSTYLKIHVRTVHMKIPMPPRVRNRKRVD